MNLFTLDTIAHLAELISAIGVFGIIWRVNLSINRIASILKDFPLHVHEYGRDGKQTIRYPKGYEPGLVQTINGESK